MIDPTYTPEVLRIAGDIRNLSIGELIALRDSLSGEWDVLPPDIGVREPRRPPDNPPLNEGAVAG